MVINWRHPLVEIPQDGQKIFYIDWHWKKSKPGSYQIIGGTFSKAPKPELHHRVEEEDEHGGGGYCYEWPKTAYDMYNCNYVGAWIPAEEINIAAWLLEE